MLIINAEKSQNKYICYSPPLHRFIERHGIMCVKERINVSNNKRYWVYALSEELSSLLTEWTKSKPMEVKK